MQGVVSQSVCVCEMFVEVRYNSFLNWSFFRAKHFSVMSRLQDRLYSLISPFIYQSPPGWYASAVSNMFVKTLCSQYWPMFPNAKWVPASAQQMKLKAGTRFVFASWAIKTRRDVLKQSLQIHTTLSDLEAGRRLMTTVGNWSSTDFSFTCCPSQIPDNSSNTYSSVSLLSVLHSNSILLMNCLTLGGWRGGAGLSGQLWFSLLLKPGVLKSDAAECSLSWCLMPD